MNLEKESEMFSNDIEKIEDKELSCKEKNQLMEVWYKIVLGKEEYQQGIEPITNEEIKKWLYDSLMQEIGSLAKEWKLEPDEEHIRKIQEEYDLEDKSKLESEYIRTMHEKVSKLTKNFDMSSPNVHWSSWPARMRETKQFNCVGATLFGEYFFQKAGIKSYYGSPAGHAVNIAKLSNGEYLYADFLVEKHVKKMDYSKTRIDNIQFLKIKDDDIFFKSIPLLENSEFPSSLLDNFSELKEYKTSENAPKEIVDYIFEFQKHFSEVNFTSLSKKLYPDVCALEESEEMKEEIERKRIEHIKNKNKSSEINSEQESQEFEWSPKNPPPLEILESKVFAVHATPILPENGKLKAGARDISINHKSEDGEPPSFRPTIHFALGELVQEHSYGSWEKDSYAIISPLKNLEDQLVNISPNDTFILGDLQLERGMILLVPKGTDVSKVPQGVEIEEYDQKDGLRKAVDLAIAEKRGWHIQMKPEGVRIGSFAYIKGMEINDLKFFQSLFEKYPHISFGIHINSERGDAFRFGVIEQALYKVIKRYSNQESSYSTTEVLLHKAFIVHNLQKLEQVIKNSSIVSQALTAFEEKKEKLLSLLNFIECDLEIRQRLGKTFSGAPESIQKIMRAQINDSKRLKEFIDDICSELPDAVQESKLSSAVLAEMFSGMPVQELEQFRADNEEIFDHVDLPEFYSRYAVKRWIVIKNEQARYEGLDQLLVNSLRKLPVQTEEENGIFKDLNEFLDEESNRLEVALTILKNPAIKKYLAQKFGMQFEEKGPTNLREVITAHPETRILFESQDIPLFDKQKEAYQLLDLIGQIYKPKINLRDGLKNFREASSFAFDVKHSRDRLQQNLETILKPMNTARSLGELAPGRMPSLYEILQRDEKPVELWRKVGLDKEYRQRFKTDSAFWNSDWSLIKIYETLKMDHKRVGHKH